MSDQTTDKRVFEAMLRRAAGISDDEPKPDRKKQKRSKKKAK